MTYTYRQIPYGSDLYRQAVSLRETVLRLPLGLRTRPEDTAHDHQQLHFAACDKEQPVACLCVAPQEGAVVKLRQMAVSPSYQHRGIGKALLRYAEQHVKEQGYERATLHARAEALPFYTACGYTAEGETFTEVGIPHMRMHKLL